MCTLKAQFAKHTHPACFFLFLSFLYFALTFFLLYSEVSGIQKIKSANTYTLTLALKIFQAPQDWHVCSFQNVIHLMASVIAGVMESSTKSKKTGIRFEPTCIKLPYTAHQSNGVQVRKDCGNYSMWADIQVGDQFIVLSEIGKTSPIQNLVLWMAWKCSYSRAYCAQYVHKIPYTVCN